MTYGLRRLRRFWCVLLPLYVAWLAFLIASDAALWTKLVTSALIGASIVMIVVVTVRLHQLETS
jgi:hypothetical protein